MHHAAGTDLSGQALRPPAAAGAPSQAAGPRKAGRDPAALRYRLGVASRAVGAIGGGYCLAALVATVLSLALPVPRVEAALIGTLTSFVVYAVAVMWVFAARTAGRAWLGLLLPGALLGAALVLHHLVEKASS